MKFQWQTENYLYFLEDEMNPLACTDYLIKNGS